ncbi:hypothetical protein D3C81_604800 [compost metagenome]
MSKIEPSLIDCLERGQHRCICYSNPAPRQYLVDALEDSQCGHDFAVVGPFLRLLLCCLCTSEFLRRDDSGIVNTTADLRLGRYFRPTKCTFRRLFHYFRNCLENPQRRHDLATFRARLSFRLAGPYRQLVNIIARSQHYTRINLQLHITRTADNQIHPHNLGTT